MSDEYLFEKQGSDGEIEKLESLLSVYRIEPVVPKLPTAVLDKTLNGRFGWFKFSYGFAFATLVLIFAAAVTTLQFLDRSAREVTSISPVETPEIDRPFVAPSNADQAAIDRPTTINETTAEIKNLTRPMPVALHRSRKPAVNNVVAVKTPRLTKEEKYAYDQLKVALWITGSKLKVVQDTIDRVDDKRSETANEKR